MIQRRLSECRAAATIAQCSEISTLSVLEWEKEIETLKRHWNQIPLDLKVKCTHAIALHLLSSLLTMTSQDEMEEVCSKLVHIISADHDCSRHSSDWDGSDPEYSSILIQVHDDLDKAGDVLSGDKTTRKDGDEKLLAIAGECSTALKVGFDEHQIRNKVGSLVVARLSPGHLI